MSSLFGKKAKNGKRKLLDDAASSAVKKEEASSSIQPEQAEDGSSTVRLHKQEDEHVDYQELGLRYHSFDELGLAEPLVTTCRSLGFTKPTPVQRCIIPYLLRNRTSSLLALAQTGSGKTAAFVLPILHHLSADPYGIYAVILSPTRELAQQIQQQVLALGSAAYNVQSVLAVGGLDTVHQSCALDKQPHIVVATPGRFAALLRGPNPPKLAHTRYLVLDEADRLLSGSGFERDVAELLLHCRGGGGPQQQSSSECQTLLFSATLTASLSTVEELAGAGGGHVSLRKFVIRPDGEAPRKKKKINSKENTDATCIGKGDLDENGDDDSVDDTIIPKIPIGLEQEYVFMPARVRDAYLLATLRTLMANGGRSNAQEKARLKKMKSRKRGKIKEIPKKEVDQDNPEAFKAKSAIVFVSTCERAALISGILDHVGVPNVALHSLLSQHRRLAALGTFQSEQVRVLVATDVGSRGLDIPNTDLVINVELPRNPVNYVHRVGRTARAGRRGRAVSLVAETDVQLVHAAEAASGRPLVKCTLVTEKIALTMLGPAAKATRLTKLKLADIGFDDLVQRFKERKVRDRKERQRVDRSLRKQMKNTED